MATFDKEIRFVSNNEHKLREAAEILSGADVRVIPASLKIDELQTDNTEKLVRDKVLKAVRAIGRPLFVEHTGLYLDSLSGFPGGLTQVFWDTIQAERFAQLFGVSGSNKVIARTAIAYCDGRKIHRFDGEITGVIVDAPRGPRDFQWDCVFQADGQVQTFAEMGARKNDISMRRDALMKLAEHLRRETRR